jgi:hypothetical protein
MGARVNKNRADVLLSITHQCAALAREASAVHAEFLAHLLSMAVAEASGLIENTGAVNRPRLVATPRGKASR